MTEPKTGPYPLTTAEVAERVGIKVKTVRKHRERGTMPEPDGQLGRTPWWYSSTIDAWIASRRQPGQRGPGRGES